MLSMVIFISGLVHFYSIGYMEKDVSLVRFISYLSLFTFFMFILVSSDNFVQLFLG
jgi:NADH-quinone oxidoreductase subunit L